MKKYLNAEGGFIGDEYVAQLVRYPACAVTERGRVQAWASLRRLVKKAVENGDIKPSDVPDDGGRAYDPEAPTDRWSPGLSVDSMPDKVRFVFDSEDIGLSDT